MTRDEAKKMFEEASFFDPKELQGWYEVKMVSVLTIPGHKKYFYPVVNSSTIQFGNNYIGTECLYFDVVKPVFEQDKPVTPVMLRYKNEKITDKLMKVRDGLFIGKFFVIVFGKHVFLDYFTLEKIND